MNSKQQAVTINILNAIPANSAILNSDGTIAAVNETWQQFADDNDFQGADHGVGQNYLAVCDAVKGPDRELALRAAQGIRAVLNGDTVSFSIEYPCDSPITRRWFRLLVTPIALSNGRGAAVMHFDDTRRFLADEALLQRNVMLADLKDRELSARLASTLESIADAFYTLDHDWCFTYLNREAERLMQRPRGALLGRNLWEEFPLVRGSVFEHQFREVVATQLPTEFEAYFPPWSSGPACVSIRCPTG